MKYKIKHTDGIVTFRMRTGRDLVRSSMPITFANAITNKSKNIVEVDGEIIVDDLYFFPIEHKKKKSHEVVNNE